MMSDKTSSRALFRTRKITDKLEPLDDALDRVSNKIIVREKKKKNDNICRLSDTSITANGDSS